MGLTSDTRWASMAALSGVQPAVLDEVGDIKGGDGMRLTLFPYHLLCEVRATSAIDGFMMIAVDDLLDALVALNRKVGS